VEFWSSGLELRSDWHHEVACQMSLFFFELFFLQLCFPFFGDCSSALHVIGLADGLCQVAKTFEVVQSLVFVPFCGDLNGLSTDV
jgi:hypothetical protein